MLSCLLNDDRTVHPVFRQLHSDNAVVTEIENILLPEEAAYLAHVGVQNGFSDSTVVKNGAHERDQQRTSRTAFLAKNVDVVVDCIGRRIATLANQPFTHMEPMQVTDYTHKQEYRAHHDYFGSEAGGAERTTTVFAYLNEKNCSERRCGGATTFHELKQPNGEPLRVYPKVGNAVIWSNRTADGKLNPATLHSGEKLTCENAHKVGLNAWFRDRRW